MTLNDDSDAWLGTAIRDAPTLTIVPPALPQGVARAVVVLEKLRGRSTNGLELVPGEVLGEGGMGIDASRRTGRARPAPSRSRP